MGFEESTEKGPNECKVFRVKGGTLFPILLGSKKTKELAFSVESLEDFRSLHDQTANIEGQKQAPVRKLEISWENNCNFIALERNGSSAFNVEKENNVQTYIEALEAFNLRNRHFESDEEGVRETRKLVEKFALNLESPRLASAFFRSERVYWQGRNKAAQIQKSSQDSLGLGWANHDHHTFRSSRANFRDLIKIFELMGLKRRERFHAGAQAGWGAQILEDTTGRMVVFADVDLEADEKDEDFAHEGLLFRDRFGTVGLWVALHGESILQAGMHHLASRFSFEAVRETLEQKGVAMMKPFSDFPFLKQAFTQAENWIPEKRRVRNLVSNGQLNNEQSQKFLLEGTLGSHLENIQRNQGFKGFNQESVSAIIRWTDPRLQKPAQYA
jgi:hypothetical protein